MNEWQEGILASAFRWDAKVPKIRYGTGPNRFGQTDEYMDCSGATHTWYSEGTGGALLIGRDTGEIARHDGSLGELLPVRSAKPADLVLRRDGTVYDGGGDEHVGLVYRFAGDVLWTYESAGSQGGVGLYPRPVSFWNHAFHYFALDRAPQPTEDTMDANAQRLLFAMLAHQQDQLNWLINIEIKGGWDQRGKVTPRTQQILAKVSQ